MKVGDKLYLVTRKDLPFGVQASQLVHVATEFSKKHPELHQSWHNNSNFICLLSVKDEEELNLLLANVNANSIASAYFRESDLENQMTAIALEPKGKKFVKHLKLAFKEVI